MYSMDIDYGLNGKFSFGSWYFLQFKYKVMKWQRFMIDNNGWNVFYFENYDQLCFVSCFVFDFFEYCVVSVKFIVVFMGFQFGILFIY